MTDAQQGQRIAKLIARAGYCSRREAEKWILSGRVKVNGELIKTAALNVDLRVDKVMVDNQVLSVDQPTARLWLYYKPPGLLTTHHDPQNRPIIFDHLPKDLPRVLSVGRLDLNSEGLILLTNDGGLARFLEMSDWLRKYRVRSFGNPPDHMGHKLSKGIVIDGVRYKPVSCKLEHGQGKNKWYQVTLSEGKNREIRKVFDAFGLSVNRLIRVAYGTFSLGNLKSGQVKEVPSLEVEAVLREAGRPQPSPPNLPMVKKKTGTGGKQKGDRP